jgi:hypothetical protein
LRFIWQPVQRISCKPTVSLQSCMLHL